MKTGWAKTEALGLLKQLGGEWWRSKWIVEFILELIFCYETSQIDWYVQNIGYLRFLHANLIWEEAGIVQQWDTQNLVQSAIKAIENVFDNK